MNSVAFLTGRKTTQIKRHTDSHMGCNVHAGRMILPHLELFCSKHMNMNFSAELDGDYIFFFFKEQHQIHQKGISPEYPCECSSSPLQLVKPDVPDHRIQQGCTKTRDKDTHSH